jgi:hypothetical protein
MDPHIGHSTKLFLEKSFEGTFAAALSARTLKPVANASFQHLRFWPFLSLVETTATPTTHPVNMEKQS